MKKILLLCMFLAFLLVVWFQKDNLQEKEPSNANKTNEITTNTINSTKYIEYSPVAFENSKDKQRILFFYANWCPKCRPVDNELNANHDKLPTDSVVIRVNYNDSGTSNDERELAKKYAVTYQHTFVLIDADGNEIKKWAGGDLSQILENVNTAIVAKRAAFAIFTNGTFRVFTASMYHNLSEDVYIDSAEPNVVKVEISKITWGDFFETLPFELTNDCITTGTKESFCSGNSGTLNFYLNGNSYENVLDAEIQNGDRLLVTFGNETETQILQQMQKVPYPLVSVKN